MSEVTGFRGMWEAYPQCAIYNGEGGPDDFAGIPVSPFRHNIYFGCPNTTDKCENTVTGEV